MRITAVDLYEVDVPDRHWAWSDDEFGMPGHRQNHIVFMVLRTDAGLHGVGELNLRFPRSLVEAEAATWVGLDPMAMNLSNLASLISDTPAAHALLGRWTAPCWTCAARPWGAPCPSCWEARCVSAWRSRCAPGTRPRRTRPRMRPGAGRRASAHIR